MYNSTIEQFGLKNRVDYGHLDLDCKKYSENSIKIFDKHFTLQEVEKNNKYKSIVQEYFFKKQEDNYISSFIKSNYKEGYIIPVKKNCDIKNISISQLKKNSLVYVMIIIEENAKVELTEIIDVLGLLGVYFEIVVMKNAKVKYLGFSSASKNKTLLVNRNIYLQQNSRLDVIDINLNYNKYFAHTNVYLEKNAKVSVNGINYLKSFELYDVQTNIFHEGEGSESEVVYKKIIASDNKSFFKTLINIKKGKENCTGRLREDNLIISKDVNFSTTPQLEINNNEVQCSHEVTITRINEEKKFYIQSKGVSEEEAERLLLDAHIAPVLERIDNIGVSEDITAQINKLIN